MAYMASGLPGTGIARAANISRVGVNTGAGKTIGFTAGTTALGAGIGAAALGGAKGGLAGAAIGGAIGAAGAIRNVIGTARKNQQIITESPFYNQSLLTAERLNASGNIVLGMHNGRRG
jgi:hypothetical protein